MNLVALLKEKFRKVSAILTGYAGDKSGFHEIYSV
jgi:pyridoxal/pyridoxine/pyridoxamine kinase